MKAEFDLSKLMVIVSAIGAVQRLFKGGSTRKEKAVGLIKAGLGVTGTLKPELAAKLDQFIDLGVEIAQTATAEE